MRLLPFVLLTLPIFFLTIIVYGQEENCTYVIVVKTSNAMEASTSDPIHVRFRDVKGNTLVHENINVKLWRPITIPSATSSSSSSSPSPSPPSPFHRGSTDHFKVSGTCMEGEVCALYFKHIGEDDWIPFNAQVYAFEDLDQGLVSLHKIGLPVYFRRPLPRNAWHGETYCHIHSLSHSLASSNENLNKFKANIL